MALHQLYTCSEVEKSQEGAFTPLSTNGKKWNRKGENDNRFLRIQSDFPQKNKTSCAISTLALVCITQIKACLKKMFPSYLSDQSLQEATTGFYWHFHIANNFYYILPRIPTAVLAMPLVIDFRFPNFFVSTIFRFVAQTSWSDYWYDLSIVGSI